MKDLNLEKDKIYSIYVKVSYKDIYDDNFNSIFTGTVNCTKDITLTDESLANLLRSYPWYNCNFKTVNFTDVTDLVNEINILREEMSKFDWNNKEYTDFEKLADIELELNNKINPRYFGAFDIEKTI